MRHVHLIDGAPTGHLARGDGILPLGEIVTALARHAYARPATVDPFGDGSYALNPRPAMERSLAAIEAG